MSQMLFKVRSFENCPDNQWEFGAINARPKHFSSLMFDFFVH
jgi:hypothetical protein